MPLQNANIRGLQRRLQKAHRNVPKIAAIEAERYFTRSFREEKWEGKKWEPLKDGDKAKRSDRRGLLVKSGRLMRGFQRGYAMGKYAVAVVNATPYAPVHNEGLRVRGVQNVRAHHRRQGNSRTQVSSHTRKVDFKMPQRQFMGNSAQLNKLIRRKIIVNYRRAL